MNDQDRNALARIASASPCVYLPGTDQERTCKLCLALIDEARDALGLQRWPAEFGTLVVEVVPPAAEVLPRGALPPSDLRPFDIEVAAGYQIVQGKTFSRYTMQRHYRKIRLGWRKVSGVMATDAKEALCLYLGKQPWQRMPGNVRAVPWRSKSAAGPSAPKAARVVSPKCHPTHQPLLPATPTSRTEDA